MRRLSVLVLFGLTCCQGYPRGTALCTRTPRYARLAPPELLVRSACVDASAMPGFAAGAQVQQAISDAGLSRVAGARCELALVLTSAAPTDFDDEAGAIWVHGAELAERYAVKSTLVQGQPTSTIYATTDRGAVYGVRAALASLSNGSDGTAQNGFQRGTLVDYPSFALRGIVESIYGKTYTLQERQTAFQLMSCLRENIYVYGAKDIDLYTHYQWADPYPDAEGQVLRESALAAAANLISFVWAISPGWWGGDDLMAASICYSCDADFERLKSKTAAMRGLGITRFALLLDDLSPSLPWPADQASFSSLAAAHAFLINRWDDYLMATGATEHLLIVGDKYTSSLTNVLNGQGFENYNQELGATLRAGIQVFWTGPEVFSPSIEVGDLTVIEGLLQQKPVIWDNWPVTVTALDSRAGDLPTAAAGFLSCPVINQRNAHPVSDFWKVLGTIADYAWQPDRYVPTDSWSRWNAVLPAILR